MAEKQKSVLEDLYADVGPFDEARVAAALKRVLSLQRENHAVFFKRDVTLTAEHKVLAYGLVKKLLKSQGIEQSSSMSGAEFANQTGVKKGTVDFTFKKLREDGLLIGSGTNYEIPMHKVEDVVERLESLTSGKKK